MTGDVEVGTLEPDEAWLELTSDRARRTVRSSFWWLFLAILPASWVFGLWARPFGPALLGVYWAPSWR